MDQVVYENSKKKKREETFSWRNWIESNDCVIYNVIWYDLMNQIQNKPNKICQKIKNRFVGEYQWYFKQEISRIQELVENLEFICDFVDLCNLLQFIPNYAYTVKEFIRNNKKLFKYNDLLYVTLPDILKYQFFGFKTTFFDADKVEAEHDEEAPIFEQSEAPDDWVEGMCYPFFSFVIFVVWSFLYLLYRNVSVHT